MRFYHVKDDYIEFLKQYDSKVPNNKLESRPYVGVLIEVDNRKYYAPMSSPKPKHIKMKNSLDFHKIQGGKLGAININNMIPIVDEALIVFEIEDIVDERYRNILRQQYKAIKAKEHSIIKRADDLRKLLMKDDNELSKHQIAIKERCCDLKTLENVFKDYVNKTL